MLPFGFNNLGGKLVKSACVKYRWRERKIVKLTEKHRKRNQLNQLVWWTSAHSASAVYTSHHNNTM